MWILQFLPDWVFYLVFFVSLALILATHFIKVLPQAQLIKLLSAAAIIFSIYMMGAISNNNAWLSRVKELEIKVANAEAKSAATNTEIVEKTVIKTQVVRERGKNIVQYVDREVVKYDNTCVIPQEFITAHNNAAKAQK